MKIRLMIGAIALSCTLGVSAMENDPNDNSEGTRLRSSGRPTRLESLVSQGKYEMVEELIGRGETIITSSPYRPTLLFRCSGKNGALMVPMLVKQGAKLNTRDSEGRTCLMQAMYFEDGAMVNALIAAGADEKGARKAIEQKGYNNPKENAARVDAIIAANVARVDALIKASAD